MNHALFSVIQITQNVFAAVFITVIYKSEMMAYNKLY